MELSWLREDGFHDLVANEWESIDTGRTQNELGRIRSVALIRRFLKGWAKHRSGKYIKEKERLLVAIDNLDIKAETFTLDVSERDTL